MSESSHMIYTLYIYTRLVEPKDFSSAFQILMDVCN